MSSQEIQRRSNFSKDKAASLARAREAWKKEKEAAPSAAQEAMQDAYN
jgi:hypothetical protein